MGTDIHLKVEHRRNGRWYLKNPPKGYSEDEYDNKYGYWFSGRNYRLFAALADVRNGTGFAGCVTGEAIKPISFPRGLPSNLSLELRKKLDKEEWVLGDHSFSWLGLKEILAYNWDQLVVTIGVVKLEEFTKRVEKYGTELPVNASPYEGWSGWTSGQRIVVMSAEDMIRDKTTVLPAGLEIYVQDKWRRPLRESIHNEWFKFVDTIKQFGVEDTRIVFGFDS